MRCQGDGARLVSDGARSFSDGARSVSDGARSVGEKKILFKNLYRVMEDYKVVDDEQGGFRRWAYYGFSSICPIHTMDTFRTRT